MTDSAPTASAPTAGLTGWSRAPFTAAGRTHDVYRKGDGPGVVLIPEIPGITPQTLALGDFLVGHGFTVVMPSPFGDPGRSASVGYVLRVVSRLCVASEFQAFATGAHRPIADYVRAVAADLAQSTPGPGVGVIGMCFTGGFALAMMVDPAVVAPVLAQPSLPFAVSKKRGADLNLAPADLTVVKQRAAEGCAVLGLRYAQDKATGTRFATLHRELGDAFRFIEFPGAKHATLTEHRQQAGVDAVLEFLSEKLTAPS